MNMVDQSNIERFRKQLIDHYNFPTLYLFKFIVPEEQKKEFEKLFSEISFDTKNSKTGKYISFSKKLKVNSSEEVIEIYKRAYSIKGIISL
jgi:hypothetical protein